MKNSLDLTWKIDSREKYLEYIAFKNKKLTEFWDTNGTQLEKLLLDTTLDQVAFCNARRTGKTFKVLSEMAFDWIHLPWCNVCGIRKYQEQSKTNLIPVLMQVLEEFVKAGILTANQRRMMKKSGDTVVYQRRLFTFLSLNNPHNATGYPASNDAIHNAQPLYTTVFVDEVIQSNDNMSLTAEQTLANFQVIKDSLFRGFTPPFGATNEKVYFACNPWDFQNTFYLKEIENVIPVGSHYVRKDMEKWVSDNHKELIQGSHELVRIYDKSGRKCAVHRASCHIIPEHRWSKMMKAEYQSLKDEDLDAWKCIYAGIHGSTNNPKATYLSSMSKRPPFYKGEDKDIKGIYFGFDRGVFDDTALVITGLAKTKEGYDFVVLGGLRLTRKEKQTGQDRAIFLTIDYLTKWFESHYDWVGFEGVFDLVCDHAAKDFNIALQEALNKTPLGNRLVVKKCKKLGESKDGWGIKTRQDFFNGLFSNGKFLFHKDCPANIVEIIWQSFQNCLSNDRGLREEKAGFNKLDFPNALEYSISLINKAAFWQARR